MAAAIHDVTTTVDAFKVAIAGAAAGGCFALFNQLINRIWDAVAASRLLSRQSRGLLAAALSEVVDNIDTLADLLVRLRRTRELAVEGTGEKDVAWWQEAGRNLGYWLASHSIQDARWIRFAQADAPVERGLDALMMLPGHYKGAREVLAQATILSEDGSPFSLLTLGHLIANVESELIGAAYPAVLLGLGPKDARTKFFWVLLMPRLAHLDSLGLHLPNVKPSPSLLRQLGKLGRHAKSLGVDVAEEHSNAVRFLGVS